MLFMKRLFLIALSTLFINYSFGQNLNYKDYASNEFEVFSSIDSNYLNFYIKELKVKNLTEVKYFYDTLGKVKDSSLINYYSFDTYGRIIERRFEYRFNSTKYKSVKFTYENDGRIIETINDPFEREYVISGMYVSDKLPMYCEYRNRSYQIETINIQTKVDGNILTMKFSYNPDLYVNHINYKEYLISGLDFLEGERIKYRHKISYVR